MQLLLRCLHKNISIAEGSEFDKFETNKISQYISDYWGHLKLFSSMPGGLIQSENYYPKIRVSHISSITVNEDDFLHPTFIIKETKNEKENIIFEEKNEDMIIIKSKEWSGLIILRNTDPKIKKITEKALLHINNGLSSR